MTLSDGRVIFFQIKQDGKECGLSLAEYVPPTWMMPEEQIRIRLILTAMLPCVASPPLCIRMCPPLTVKNWGQYRPLLAVGTSAGGIQIFNLASGLQEKEISVHACATRGIEWTSLSSVLSFGYPSITGQVGVVRNEIVHTNLATGACTSLRTDRGEESPMELIRVSYLKRYFIIGFKDNPFELWDLDNFIMLRNINKKFPVLTAVEWSPNPHKKSENRRDSDVAQLLECLEKEPKAIQKEHFIFTDTDGRRFHCLVEGSVVKDGTKMKPTDQQSTVTSIAWKGECLVWGDSDGSITMWDLKTSRSLCPAKPHRVATVKKVRFAPGKGNFRLLTLYHDGLQIWDVKDAKLLEHIACPKDMVKIIDADWAASDKPVIATADGCIRVLDLSLKVTTSCMSEYAFAAPFLCPSAFGIDALANFRMTVADKACLQNELSPPELDLPQAVSKDVLHQLEQIGPHFREKLLGASTVERCRIAALITGDEWLFTFWIIVGFYLDPTSSPTLDSCFDIFCDTPVFQTLVHECKRVTYEHTQKVIYRLIMLNEMDKATQILLETDNKQDGYYADSLRACLAATLHQSRGELQSTVKLVATNLIASDKLHEGIQLLCMIKKYADSCRYMQSYGLWEPAAELAKLTLNAQDKTEAFRRWVEHLSSTEQKHKAVLVWVSLKNFPKACELLLAMNNIPTAAYLVQSCQEKGAWEDNAYNKKLQSVLNRELARHCQMIGNKTAHQYYAKQENVCS